MDFELKHLLKDAPRFREDVKTEVHTIAKQIVERCCMISSWLKIERLLQRHVLLIFMQMACDPQVRMTRNGICKQHSKIKSMSKLFQQSILKTTEGLAEDARYGQVDKRLVKGVRKILDDMQIRYSVAAAILISGCIRDVCRILLTCTNTSLTADSKTINLQNFKNFSCKYKLSSGEVCENDSLIRFLHSIKALNTFPSEFQTKQPKINKKVKISDREPCDEETSPIHERQDRRVSFTSSDKSPQDLCFWEDK